LKILIFAPWTFSTDYYTAKYCNAISEKNIKVYLIVPRNFLFELLSENVIVLDWGRNISDKSKFIDFLHIPFDCFRLIRILKRLKPDWFHILWLHHVPSLIYFVINKYKIAYTVHDPILHKGEGGKIRNWVQKKIIKTADVFFVHGLENKRLLVDNYKLNNKQVHVIPHGEFIFWDKDKFNIKQEKIILFFGRIRKYKGLEILISAFEKIYKQIPDYKLFIVGQGDIEEFLPKIHSNSNIVLVNRYIEHNEVATFILRSKFVVLPYTQATQSGVIPMVFALERTCIATNVGAISEIVKHKKTGLLIQPSDSDELADSILFLVKNEELCTKMQSSAFEYINKSAVFSWEKTAEIAYNQYII